MKIFFRNSVLLAFSLVVLISCEDEVDEVIEPTVTTADVHLNYSFKFGEQDFELNKNYTTDSGYTVRFTLATYYLSNPSILDDAGNGTALSADYLFVRPDAMMSDLGSIEAGHAHMFNVSSGIDEATNTEDGGSGLQPTDFNDANHPLAPQAENMYWSWASGYIFVKIEGEVDFDNDGTFDGVFKYHLGTNEFRKDRSLMLHSDVAAGETLDISMKVDYKAFFAGVDLNTELVSMSMGLMRPLGEKMMAQFDSATSFEVGSGDGSHGKDGRTN
jgi:hypothetical protein